jgi:hypothetical protein
MPDWMHVRYEPTREAVRLADEDRRRLRIRLQTLQSARLRATHQDLARHPRYAALAEFFFRDIYGPQEFHDRDARFRQLYSKLVAIVGPRPLELMREALELAELTEVLDDYLLDVLVLHGRAQTLTLEDYEWAYRTCDNYPARVEQIERTGATIRAVSELGRLPLIDWQLNALRLPASRLGWTPTLDFLIRGYRALRRAGDIEPFIATVETREMARLARLYERPATT